MTVLEQETMYAIKNMRNDISDISKAIAELIAAEERKTAALKEQNKILLDLLERR